MREGDGEAGAGGQNMVRGRWSPNAGRGGKENRRGGGGAEMATTEVGAGTSFKDMRGQWVGGEVASLR